MEQHIFSWCAKLKHSVFADPRAAWLWLVVRLFLASVWIQAGYTKVMSSAWVGMDAGGPIKGFVAGALTKAAGEHPDVLGFYAAFLENCVASIPTFWSHLVAFGELAVGLGLLFGVLTTSAAFFASVMNMSFLMAGAVSLNPYLLALQIPLIFAWRVSSRFGLVPVFRRVFRRRRNVPGRGDM